jgi:hypothetical protein
MKSRIRAFGLIALTLMLGSFALVGCGAPDQLTNGGDPASAARRRTPTPDDGQSFMPIVVGDAYPVPTTSSTPRPTVRPTASGTAVATARPTATSTPVATATARPTASSTPAATPGAIWRPAPGTTWQWQLTGLPIDQSFDVAMYDIDLFDNDASVVAALHAKGRKVICYISAGTWEDWRPDAAQFPAAVKGSNVEGWPGEKWLDVRNLAALGPIMEARMDLCKAKGFDGIEPDNVDGYTNNTGFQLTAQHQIAYNTFLAQAAHKRGLSVGLKNDLDQVGQLQPSFDWAMNEQCFQYDECDALTAFIQAGKAVFQVEYSLSASAFCPQAKQLRFSSMLKHLDLDAYRVACS